MILKYDGSSYKIESSEKNVTDKKIFLLIKWGENLENTTGCEIFKKSLKSEHH